MMPFICVPLGCGPKPSYWDHLEKLRCSKPLLKKFTFEQVSSIPVLKSCHPSTLRCILALMQHYKINWLITRCISMCTNSSAKFLNDIQGSIFSDTMLVQINCSNWISQTALFLLIIMRKASFCMKASLQLNSLCEKIFKNDKVTV